MKLIIPIYPYHINLQRVMIPLFHLGGGRVA